MKTTISDKENTLDGLGTAEVNVSKLEVGNRNYAK
jgi:hypothetical protein